MPMYNVLVQNNLLENIPAGIPSATEMPSLWRHDPGWNLVFDHNTALNTLNGLRMGGGVDSFQRGRR